MKKNLFATINILTILVLTLQFAHSQEKAKVKNPENNRIDKYYRILDEIFYQEETKHTDILNFVIVRFLPTFSTESQILIIRKTNSAKLIYSKANTSVYAKFSNFSNDETLTSEKSIIEGIRVEKITYDLKTAQADNWINDLNSSAIKAVQEINRDRIKMSKSSTVETYLDGAFYLFWSESGVNKFHLSLYDENVKKMAITGDRPFVKLANKLRINVEKGIYDMVLL